MKITQTNRQRRRTAGFGMVEVLVTLILLSVGLMGIAKLQLVSLRSVHASSVRGQAVLLAYDLADRMRANRFAVVALNGDPVGFYNRADDDYKDPDDAEARRALGKALFRLAPVTLGFFDMSADGGGFEFVAAQSAMLGSVGAQGVASRPSRLRLLR